MTCSHLEYRLGNVYRPWVTVLTAADAAADEGRAVFGGQWALGM